MRLVPLTAIGRRSMLLASTRSLGVQAHRDVARLAGRVDPVADLDAGKGHAQGLRGVVDRDAHLVGQPAVELDLHLGLRVLLGLAHVHRARHLCASWP
jgi:hypothetical protein